MLCVRDLLAVLPPEGETAMSSPNMQGWGWAKEPGKVRTRWSAQGTLYSVPSVKACHSVIGTIHPGQRGRRTRADVLAAACRMDMGKPLSGQRGHGSSLGACPTATARSGTAGSTTGSPSPGHRAPPWGWGQAEARLGHSCGELETTPAAASLGQGLTALGG